VAQAAAVRQHEEPSPRRRRVPSPAALLVAVLALAPADVAARDAASESVLLRNAAVYTADPVQPWATAVLIEHGRIAYVGDDAGARARLRADTHVVDLGRRMVLPAFHDSHAHPMSGGMRLLRCRLDGLASEAAIRKAVRRCATEAAHHAWLLGGGWTPGSAASRRLTLKKLDALVPDRPALLTTQDGFAAWVNSRALAAAKIDPADTSLDGLHRDAAGREPTGIVEGAALRRLRSVVPQPTQVEYRQALRQASALANRFGIVSIVDASANAEMLEAYAAAADAGELSLRVVAAQRIDARRGPEQIDEMVARRERVRRPLFRADAAKIFLDAEFENHTAALLEPYADAPDTRGDLPIDSDTLDAIVARLDAEGFMIHMHGMGDRAVRAGLDAIERAMRRNSPRDRRHQIAHIGVASTEDVRRFAALGITANFQPIWFQADDPATGPSVRALGAERARRMFPIASIASAGGRILASSDWPSPSMNPLDAIQTAITHQPLDGGKPPLQPDQRLRLSAILAAYTRDAAWSARAESTSGSITVGKDADIIVLDRNLFETDLAKLHEVHVVLTLMAGRPVYRDARVGVHF